MGDDWTAHTYTITIKGLTKENGTIGTITTDINFISLTEELKKDQATSADRNTASTVSNTITSLPGSKDITLDNTDAIEAARSAYNALTDAQKAYVSADSLDALRNAEKQILVLKADAVDKEASGKVIASINGVKDDLTLEDEVSIASIRKAYDALTDTQKALVGDDVLTKLTKAESTIATLKVEAENKKAAAAVEAVVNKLPATIAIGDEAQIKGARAAYDALSAEQKAMVDQAVLEALTKAEARKQWSISFQLPSPLGMKPR